MLEDYAESCRRVGKELKVPVIDLHSYSFRLWCDMGPDTYPDYFMDTTHTNDYGALLAAKFISEEIRRLEIEPLCAGMNDYAGEAGSRMCLFTRKKRCRGSIRLAWQS